MVSRYRFNPLPVAGQARRMAVLGMIVSLAGCVENLDLSNPHDPESPEFVPDPPEAVQPVMVNDRLVHLSWADISSFEERYLVERRLGTVGAWTLINTLAPNAFECTDTTGVVTDTTYFYRVSAVTKERPGISRESSLFSRFPPPTDLRVGASSESLAVLSWNDNSSFEAGFTLLRSAGNGPLAHQITLEAGIVQATDHGLLIDDDYAYAVRAFTSTNVSKNSQPIHIRCVPDSLQQIMFKQFSGGGFGPTALSKDGRVFAVFTNIYVSIPPTRYVFVFDTQTGQQLATLPVNSDIIALAMRADGTYLVGSTQASDVFGWPIPGGQQQIFASGSFYAPGLAISPDGRTLAATGYGIRLFDIGSTGVTASWVTSATIGRVVFSPDGGAIYLIRSGDVWRHDASTASPIVSFSIPGATGYSFDGNGQYVAGFGGNSISIARLSDGTIIGSAAVPAGLVCTSGDGRFCVVSSPTQPWHGDIVDTRNRKSVRTVEWGSYTGAVPLSLALSSDSGVLAAASGTDIHVWRLRYRWREMP